jgi:hypothetical protein
MMFSRGRGKRLNHHGPGGRFSTPTVESAFGLRVKVCPHCRGITTLARKEDGVGFEPPPKDCHHCKRDVETWA